ncbi:MAG: M23 family metallopeptidase [Proteobacteria bacterium]|nr:M23 family metallopeptidase [Pseudomonadota bacterium]
MRAPEDKVKMVLYIRNGILGDLPLSVLTPLAPGDDAKLLPFVPSAQLGALRAIRMPIEPTMGGTGRASAASRGYASPDSVSDSFSDPLQIRNPGPRTDPWAKGWREKEASFLSDARIQLPTPGAGKVLPAQGIIPTKGTPPNYADGRYSPSGSYRTDLTTGLPRPHRGLDIAGSLGDPIRAAADGVAYAQQMTGLGNVVFVQHADGTMTLYGHLGSVKVVNGQHVSAGDQIGTMGYSGRRDKVAPKTVHLHFEVWMPGGYTTSPSGTVKVAPPTPQRTLFNLDPIDWLKTPTLNEDSDRG